MYKLSVSIVNFNAGEYLLKTLDSLSNIKDSVDLEIFIVDNNSADDSIEKAQKKYPKINYILNKENVGFGKAHNQVLKEIQDEFVLILNPDIEVKTGVLDKLLKYIDENPEVGAITPEIVFENGEVDMTAHRGLPTPWASFKYYFLKDDSLYHLKDRQDNKIHEVDSITGAFFLTKKEVLEKVGLFDEEYFMYAEDIDLCVRIKEAGFKVMYDPTIQVLHYKGISSGLKKHSNHLSTADKETKLRSLNYFYSTMKIFYKKHLAKKYPFFINWLVYLGIDIKWWFARRKFIV